MVHGLVCRDVLGGWMWTSKSIKGDYSGDYLLCWLDQLFVQVCVFACFETICYRNVANMCCKIGLAICRNLYIRYLRNKGGRWLTSSSCTALLSHVIT